ncbi:hypothetical protein COT94_00950 [Candidatus Falkowbacteria bacterium CG10_big_fil_rev_8_21_14_0_10_37_14]|uniref:Epoxyqueuosine reductase QueH n=1 Tax=Candidatus Falkowbacteria bacterium CG10_big_fil_rev_8_21_14_0_10_37_14 TaxID=1974561 RepID=A0A2M6WU74_9BACT|nr:epoxyqueuosine reductase QueH [Candidatus Falkowbacteria bacterium]PIT96347.1 MAG: hypothetical protein COT94_00950 [Candidatus Falkowbacteria bacterium CG10_big_fil_rev_8_21_14_0_10_37_14]
MHKIYKPFNPLKWIHLLIIASALLLIAVLLLTPLVTTYEPNPPFTWRDKIIHLILFGWLARLIAGWLKRYTALNYKKIIIWAIVVATSYSWLLEKIQNFIPGRTDSWEDLLAGLLGASLVAAIWYTYKQFRGDKTQPKLLLHMCCGPCGSHLSGQLAKTYDVTLFFHNPNLDSLLEFERRSAEAIKVAKYWGLPAIISDYQHRGWKQKIKGLEQEPEGGARCAVCFAIRLMATAKFAKENSFDAFTTSLSVSPHKKYNYVLVAGQAAAKKYKITFIEQDFKKKDGYKLSIMQAKKLGLYRQDYCGCEFSTLPEKKVKTIKKIKK